MRHGPILPFFPPRVLLASVQVQSVSWAGTALFALVLLGFVASSGPSLPERLKQPSPDWVPGRRLREGEGVASGEKLPGPERLISVSPGGGR